MSTDHLSDDEKRLVGTFHDRGLPHPVVDRKAPAKSRWINFQHEGWDVASPRAWAEACGAARVLLSTGERGHSVKRDELWMQAIYRVAGELLVSQKLGRPMGKVLDEWEKIVRITGSLGSAADDGMVAHESGVRVTVRSLSR